MGTRALLLFLLLAVPANGATRYYFNSVDASSVSPAYSASWTRTTSAARRTLGTSRAGTAHADATDGLTAVVDDGLFILIRQYVSNPIAAQTVSGTVSMALKCTESNAANQSSLAVMIRLRHTDGTFLTLLNINSFDTEFGTTAATRILNAQAITSQTALADDRIVVELGYFPNSPGTDGTITLRFGDNNGSDFALTSGLTTDLDPWIEFSATISGGSTASRGSFLPLLLSFLTKPLIR